MDKQYWKNFYEDHSLKEDISECSTFAKFCEENYFKRELSIVDLGCGNARDAFYFARLGHEVLGVDQSIDISIKESKNHYRLQFLEDDFMRPSSTEMT